MAYPSDSVDSTAPGRCDADHDTEAALGRLRHEPRTGQGAQRRYTGIAVSYNIAAAVIGGSTPLLLALLARQNPMWPAWYPAIFCVVAVLAALALQKYRRPINPYAA